MENKNILLEIKALNIYWYLQGLKDAILRVFSDKTLYGSELGNLKQMCEKLSSALESNMRKVAQFHKEVRRGSWEGNWCVFCVLPLTSLYPNAIITVLFSVRETLGHFQFPTEWNLKSFDDLERVWKFSKVSCTEFFKEPIT